MRVYLADGRTENVAVPDRRKKWVQVQATLERLHWYRLEALDAKGELLGVLENDEPAEALEDLTDERPDGNTARMVQLMLAAQDHALDRQRQLIDTMLANNLALSKVLMARLDALEHSHGSLLETMRELMEDFDESAGTSSGPAIMGMLAKMAGAKAPPNNNPTE